jgi:hypothetical protein
MTSFRGEFGFGESFHEPKSWYDGMVWSCPRLAGGPTSRGAIWAILHLFIKYVIGNEMITEFL